VSVVLGINAFHAGAAAAIVIDGEVKFAIAEERLNRVKYYAGFPSQAIRACLEFTGLEFKDIDYVAVGRDSSANLDKKLGYVARHPLLLANMVKMRASRKELGGLRELFSKECDIDIETLSFEEMNVEHHLAHTASAFFQSGWDECAGITIDGSGDFVTCMMSRCHGSEIEPLHRIYVPNSLGSFYSMVCQFIGYTKYGDEGKVMGLAPLGRDKYSEIFEKIIQFEDGQIKLDKKFFKPFGSEQGISVNEKGEMVTQAHYTDHMIKLFGEPRDPKAEIAQRDMDLAFNLQKRFEEIYLAMFNYLHALVPNEKVAIAGGCALNSVANGMLFDKTPFKDTVIQPAAGDEGLAVGAALYVARSKLKEGRDASPHGAYMGNEYSPDIIEAALKDRGVKYERHERTQLLDKTAIEITDGKVVGWFQGRSEWGPRSLGNRSILCHPGYPGMKDILNSRIKRRESFRPFAPVVKQERQGEIYECDYPTPYMLHVYKTRVEWRDKLTAVNHLDNTGRVQTLKREENPLYYDLIDAFESKTGIPVLINTSFNENEPVVEKPMEAIDCFLRTKMDVLVAGPFIARKAEQ